MQNRLSLLALLLLSLAACSTEPKTPKYKPPGEHGLGWKLLHPFAKKDAAPAPSATAAAFTPEPKRSLVSRVVNPFGWGEKSTAPRKSGLQVTVELESNAPSLRSASQLPIRVLVTNYTNTLVSLTFPTSQRFEIVARNIDGKILYTYSTDRNAANEVSVLTINPGERLEYDENIPTRSMTAGNTYLITANIVGQVGLEGTASINPVP